MLVIASGRKTSRTTRLIEMQAEAQHEGKTVLVICPTVQQCQKFEKKCLELHLPIPNLISMYEFTNYTHGRSFDQIYIDNADHCLQSLFGMVGNLTAIVVESNPPQELAV